MEPRTFDIYFIRSYQNNALLNENIKHLGLWRVLTYKNSVPFKPFINVRYFVRVKYK